MSSVSGLRLGGLSGRVNYVCRSALRPGSVKKCMVGPERGFAMSSCVLWVWRGGLAASLPSEEESRTQELKCVLTQGGPEVVTCAEGGIGREEGGHPHVRGALFWRLQLSS